MSSSQPPEKHRSGFVNILGNPNVGKSTLINAFLGERLCIVSPKAQTTRHRILGIFNNPLTQIVFSDTPGIITPAYKLQSVMMETVKKSFDGADLLIILVEAGQNSLKNPDFLTIISESPLPKLILINKIDLCDQVALEESVAFWTQSFQGTEVIPISALNKFNTKEVLLKISEAVPEAPPFFPKDQLTDRPERFFVNEKIREKILLYYKKEIPYAVEVVTESFVEEPEIIRIECVILVERESQKGIIIGHKGLPLKKVGTQARKSLELFFGKKIFLHLFVKVQKNWRQDDRLLQKFGYSQGS